VFVDLLNASKELFGLLLLGIGVSSVVKLLRNFLSLNRLAISCVKLGDKRASGVEVVGHLFVESILVDINQRVFGDIYVLRSLASAIADGILDTGGIIIVVTLSFADSLLHWLDQVRIS
jgi:hypothetical protein